MKYLLTLDPRTREERFYAEIVETLRRIECLLEKPEPVVEEKPAPAPKKTRAKKEVVK